MRGSDTCHIELAKKEKKLLFKPSYAIQLQGESCCMVNANLIIV